MKARRKNCSGCRDDFYDHNRMGLNETSGQPQCWNLATAVIVKGRDVPVNMPPPYKTLPLVSRPSCYKAQGYVRVKPEALDERGFWRK
jgi:hypothetical protein